MIRELKIAVSASGKEAQYDEHAKNIAGQKFIIANILAKSVEAFRGMKPKDIIPYIEGEPYISKVPVEPGLTNAVREENGQRVVGLNTENQEINEGLVRFDVICYVRLPERDGEKVPDGKKKLLTQIIINVEIQKNQPKKYKILNRSIFYVCRQISAQKERDFVGSHYDDIKNVYSIWICMNMEKNSMCHIHLTKDDIVDNQKWKGNLDLLNIIMIGIGEEVPRREEGYELHRLLGAVFSKKLTLEEKLNILQEYDVPVEEEFRKDMNEMCNLGEGILEDGIEIGWQRCLEEGRKESQQMIRNMHKNGFTAEQIAAATDMELEEVQAILA